MSTSRPPSSRRTRAPTPIAVLLIVGFVPLTLLTVGLPYAWNDQGAGSYRVTAVALLVLYIVMAGMLVVGTPAEAGQRPYGILMIVAMVGFGVTAVVTSLDEGSGRGLLLLGFALLGLYALLTGYVIGRKER